MIVRRGASSFVACGINVCQGWLSLDTRSLAEPKGWAVGQGKKRNENGRKKRRESRGKSSRRDRNGTRWRCICPSTSATRSSLVPPLSLSFIPGVPIISDCLSTSLIHLSFWGTSCRQRARLGRMRLGTIERERSKIDSRLSLEENEPRGCAQRDSVWERRLCTDSNYPRRNAIKLKWIGWKGGAIDAL